MSKRFRKYISSFNYFDKLLFVLSAACGGISIASFAIVIGIPVGIAGASFSVIFALSTGIVKNAKNNEK